MSDEGDKQSIRPRKQRHAFYKVSTGLSVDKVMEEFGISEPIRETLGKLLRQIASNNVLCKTYADFSTQTSFDDMPGEIDAVESSVECDTDDTEVKAHYEDCNVIDEKNIDKETPYDNVAFKTPMNTDYGNYSLQIRERLVTEETRRQSAVEVNTEKYDERECLANAIQFHIEDLIDGVIFRDSELPDCLLADGCLTEDECSSVRRIRDRKDQIRILVSLINGRDVYVLRGFLKRIKGHNQQVAVKIQEKFEDNKRKGLGQKLCFLCQLKNNFNVKHLADSLWAVQVIDKGVYNTIIFSDLPTGAQETLWCKVFHSLNYFDRQQAELAHQKIIKALTRQNLFTYLADGINDMLVKNHGRLSCSCEQKSLLRRRHNVLEESTSDESILPRSSSDGTPNDIASTNSTDDRTIPKTAYRKPDNMTEERPLFPTSLLQSANKQHDVGDSIPESVTVPHQSETNQPARRRRTITIFSVSAVKYMEQEFERGKYPDIRRREVIAAEIGVPEARVQVWFQNRRARNNKHRKSSAVCPGVTSNANKRRNSSDTCLDSIVTKRQRVEFDTGNYQDLKTVNRHPEMTSTPGQHHVSTCHPMFVQSYPAYPTYFSQDLVLSSLWNLSNVSTSLPQKIQNEADTTDDFVKRLFRFSARGTKSDVEQHKADDNQQKKIVRMIVPTKRASDCMVTELRATERTGEVSEEVNLEDEDSGLENDSLSDSL